MKDIVIKAVNYDYSVLEKEIRLMGIGGKRLDNNLMN